MGAVQDITEAFFADAELTRDDLDSVLAAVRSHFGQPVGVVDPALAGDHTYLNPDERFVATLAVSYEDDPETVSRPEEALRAALNLVIDDDAGDGTQWWVYDRDTGTGRIIEQGEVAHVVVP